MIVLSKGDIACNFKNNIYAIKTTLLEAKRGLHDPCNMTSYIILEKIAEIWEGIMSVFKEINK